MIIFTATKMRIPSVRLISSRKRPFGHRKSILLPLLIVGQGLSLFDQSMGT